MEAKQIIPSFVPYLRDSTDIRYFSAEFTSSPARDTLVADAPNQAALTSPTYDRFDYSQSPQVFKDDRRVPRQAHELIYRYQLFH